VCVEVVYCILEYSSIESQGQTGIYYGRYSRQGSKLRPRSGSKADGRNLFDSAGAGSRVL